MIRVNFFILILILMGACGHKDMPPKPPIWETSSQLVNVQGKAVLEYSLPENFQREEPFLSANPINASVAEIFKNADGLWAIRYQSLDGLPGKDKLSIDSERDFREGHHDCHAQGTPDDDHHHDHHHGHHHHPNEQKVLHRLMMEIQILPEEANKKATTKESQE